MGSITAPVFLPEGVDAVFLGGPPPGRWRVEVAATELADRVVGLRRRLPERAPVLILVERRRRAEAMAEALAEALARRGAPVVWQAVPGGAVAAVLAVGPEAEELVRRAVAAGRPRQGWEQACRSIGAALGVRGLRVLVQDGCACMSAGLRRAGASVVEA